MLLVMMPETSIESENTYPQSNRLASYRDSAIRAAFVLDIVASTVLFCAYLEACLELGSAEKESDRKSIVYILTVKCRRTTVITQNTV